MRLFLLSFIFLFSFSILNAQTVIIDDFEDGLPGHFNQATGYSGSSVGILSTIPVVVDYTAKSGIYSLKIELIDNPGATVDWSVRFLSGTGSPSNNQLLGATGYVGYWLKTDRPWLKCGITMDAVGLEKSDSLVVIGDGNWHLYQWDLADTNNWYAFARPGANGIIEDPVTIDAVWFYAPDGSDTTFVYLDAVSWNPTGYVPVELVSFDAAVDVNVVSLRWITSTELNNSGFEVERRTANSDFQTIGFVSGNGTTSDISYYTYNDVLETSGTYFYRLKQVDLDGTYEYTNEIQVEINAVPTEFKLVQNYPNPFNPSTTITYSIPENGMVTLKVYNIVGEEVAELVNQLQEQGVYNIDFNASNLSSGTYIYSLQLNGQLLNKKMQLMK